MRDFYRAYESAPDTMTKVMTIGWTQNVVILEAELTLQEKAWYIRAVQQFGWSKQELAKQIASAAHLEIPLDLYSEVCYTEKNSILKCLHETKNLFNPTQKHSLHLTTELLKDSLAKRAGLEIKVYSKYATRTETIGNMVNPLACRKLAERNSNRTRKMVRQLINANYDKYRPLIGTVQANLRHMHRICSCNWRNKTRLLIDHANRWKVALCKSVKWVIWREKEKERWHMGKIDNAVRQGILKKKPELEHILNPFLNDFDVSWGAERIAFNTTLDVFIIKPTEAFAEQFGLEYELLMVHTPYDAMQPRTMQAIDSCFAGSPVKGRVETLVCVIVSGAHDVREWVNAYTIENQDLRTYVAFYKDNFLQRSISSMVPEFRNQLSERDLFDVQLPLLDDLYFFGRQTILQTIINHIKQCENCGIFGLRKTGKTSLLYKIQRTVESANIGKVLIYDAKNAKIRMRTWVELLLLIMEEICRAYKKPYQEISKENKLAVVEAFENVLQSIPHHQRIVVIIDEIEYISFNPPLDKHWKQEYLDFWQFLWSMQSAFRNICFVIAGVNPQVVEISSLDTVQNPLFAIVKPYYIHGLDRQDIHDMSRRIGRRLGLKFDYTAINYLYARYSGHPLLTRLALSYENQNAAAQKPVSFTEKELIDHESSREDELIPYCQHIVDVLMDFYPNEYELLALLSVGNVQEFIQKATSPLVVKHLKNYGLLNYQNKKPVIGIPVVASYVQSVLAKKQGSQMGRTIVPPQQRQVWLTNNVKSAISYMRQLEVAIRTVGTQSLFGSNSFPEADKLLEVPVAQTENDFKVFVSTFSNCFVESIENYGKATQQTGYFWSVIKVEYPLLFDALLRIKAYRNWCEHLQLTQAMQEHVDRYLRLDLEGKRICDVHEPYFILQQCVLEELKLAISLEISALS